MLIKFYLQEPHAPQDLPEDCPVSSNGRNRNVDGNFPPQTLMHFKLKLWAIIVLKASVRRSAYNKRRGQEGSNAAQRPLGSVSQGLPTL